MTAQQLRNSILQQAIQGRLVPQDPNDEPASVLLEKIRKEKEQLVKEGKLKKKDLVVTPIADDEKPFDIPSGWEWCRICDLGITNTGSTPSKTNPSFYGSYIPFVSPGDIQNNKLSYRKDGLSELGYQVARPTPAGTILQVCIGGSIGKCAICDREITFNQQINSITPNIVDSNYIHAVLSSNYIISIMKDTTTGSATPIINKSTWENLLIPLPPLAEQRRIVAKIEELMPLIEKYGKAQTELDNLNQDLPRRLRQSVLQQAIQGKLVPLGEVAKIVTGSTPSKVNNNYYGSDYPFFKPGDLTHQYIKKSVDGLSCLGFEAARKLPPSTILVCCIGSLGKCSIIETEGSCNQQINAILPSESYDTKYLYYVIQSPNFVEQMWEKATSTTVTLLNKNKFSEILIPLPPLAEQKRIVAKIEELFANIDKLK